MVMPSWASCWRSLDQIPTSFAGTIRSMQPGQIIGPIRGPSGFQLIKLEEMRNSDAGGTGAVTQYHARHIPVSYTHLDVYKRQGVNGHRHGFQVQMT